MTEENLRKVLKEFGLTESEIEAYLCISRHGVLSGTDVAHLIKKDKAQVFRTLKNLQTKGFVEATLEIPMRFAPVAFEKVLDLTIKAKKDEAARIESTKEQLLDYWKRLNKNGLDSSLEKFAVIEGRHKVYSKISQMIAEAKSQLSAISTVSGLLKAEKFGVFKLPATKSRRTVQFRLLTEVSSQNVGTVKILLKDVTKKGFKFKAKNPDLGLNVFPQMVIRDNEEAVFFITPRTSVSVEENNLCLWTNCRDLVEAFTSVFEDLWQKASDAQDKILVIEAEKQTSKTFMSGDGDATYRKYWEIMRAAKAEILSITSSEGLNEFATNLMQPKELSENTVTMKIMAPITSKNLQTAQQLSKRCQVKHITTTYLRTTLIDQQHLFQFANPSLDKGAEEPLSERAIKNIFYTDNPQQIQKTKKLLDELWDNSQPPSPITLESIINFSAKTQENIPSQDGLNVVRKISALKISDEQVKMEQDIISRIINAKRTLVKDPTKDITRVYGFCGQAVIHPPQAFSLPDLMIHAFHNDKQSAYGSEDYMVIYMWLPTPKGPTFVPVTIVGDVKKGEKGLKAVWQGTPAAQNIKIVKKHQLQIQLHANIFFAGWTIPIPLMPPQNILPPAALTLEAVGKLNTKTFTVNMPSGCKVQLERNGYSAFVTFLHPKSKYHGPGTDGYINRDLIMTTTPP